MTYLSQVKLSRLGLRHVGKNVRISSKASIYDAERVEIGDYSRIDDFCVVSGLVRIGKHVHIAAHCLVAGGEPGVVLEDFAGLAYFVQVFSQSDDYSGDTLTNPTVPAKYKRETKLPVRIGRHVIIGSGSVVFPGVDLAEGCAVGALTLVNRSTEPWGVYVGKPARRIGDRSRRLLELESALLAEESR